ncbi:hypothetical protein D3C81_1080530 [compost metagenome]
MRLDAVTPGVAGVVDDDVDAAKGVDRGLHQALGEILGGDAADAGHGFAAGRADFRDHALSRLGIQIVDHHSGAIGGQLQGHAAADATTGAGHDGGFSCQLAHLLSSSFAQRPGRGKPPPVEHQLILFGWCSQNGLRSSVFKTLPTPDSGRASRNSTLRGTL